MTSMGSIRKIPWSDIDAVRKIDAGGYRIIYDAKLQPEGLTVAIKTNQESVLEAQQILHEAEALSMVHHPNIISLYGLTDFPTSHAGDLPALVIEHMRDGNLYDTLLGKPELDRLPWRSRLAIAAQVADAMQYMYANRMVHRDINPGNWLLDLTDPSRPVCKLADFESLLKDVDDENEYIHDIAEFGCVLWCLLSGDRGDLEMHKIRTRVSEYTPPAEQGGCNFQRWKELIMDCLMEEAAGRPNLNEVATRMRDLLDAIPAPAR